MRIKFALTMAALACFMALPVFAQHGQGGGSGHGGSSGSGSGFGHGSSSAHGEAHSSHGGFETHEHGPETHEHSGSKHGDDVNEHSGGHDSSHSGHKSVSDLLSQNTKLASSLQNLLPPGTDLQAASAGFKNLGQFVAAVHVSNNLGIPFDQLKAKVTGPGGESLGKAIHELKPDADAKAALKLAEKQAHTDLEGGKKGPSHGSDDSKKGS